INLKMTQELTLASLRAAFAASGGSIRAFHSFVSGWEPTWVGVKLGLDTMHANFSILCGRVIATLRFGNPRAPVRAPPTLAALEEGAETAAAALKGAAAALTTAEAAVSTAESSLAGATADVAAAQAEVDQVAAERAALQAQAGQGGWLQ